MDKLWKGRFQSSNNPLMERFSSSIAYDKELYKEDILGSLAHAKMLEQCGIITLEESTKICEGLREILLKIEQGSVEFSEADEDIHMNIERLLSLEIGPLAGKLHTARSRNDQVATDLHLYLRKRILEICEGLVLTQKALLLQIEENGSAIMPGYTHLQRAQPILYAQHLLAYVFMLQRDFERLSQSWSRCNQLPLGSGAIAGTKHAIDRNLSKEFLGFDSLYANSMDAVSDRDFATEFLFNCSQIMIHLSRLSEELILWSSQEFAFISIDDAFCSGSSLMPQKKNPDVPELIRGKTGRVFGSLFSLMTTMKGLPLAYNRDLQEDKEPIFDTVRTLKSVLSVLAPMLETITIDPERMLEASHGGFMNATDLADYLVAKDLPFREAHSLAGKIVRHCLDAKLNLQDLDLLTLQNFSPLFSKDVFEQLELKNVIASKKSIGGTSFESVEQQKDLVRSFLDSNRIWLNESSTRVQKIESHLI